MGKEYLYLLLAEKMSLLWKQEDMGYLQNFYVVPYKVVRLTLMVILQLVVYMPILIEVLVNGNKDLFLRQMCQLLFH